MIEMDMILSFIISKKNAAIIFAFIFPEVYAENNIFNCSREKTQVIESVLTR